MQHPAAPVPMTTHLNAIEPGRGRVNGPPRTRWGRALEAVFVGVVAVTMGAIVAAQTAAAYAGRGGGADVLTMPMGFGPLGVGGSIATYVGSFTKQTATGNQDITIPVDMTAATAGTWAVIFQTGGSTAASATFDANAKASIGMTTGASNSYSVGVLGVDASATSDTTRRVAAKCITCPDTVGTGILHEADFVSFPTSTTMRINWTTNNAGQTQVITYKIITGLTNAKVLNWTTPTTTTTKSVTGLDFRPDLVLHATDGGSAALPASGTPMLCGFGMMNKHGQQGSDSFYSNNAANPSNASMWQQTDACLTTPLASGTKQYKASFVSMDYAGSAGTGGFTTYFSTVDGAASQVISLCVAGCSSKIGSAVATGSSQTIASRHGFTPRGLIVSSHGNSWGASPQTHAAWSFGMYDGTNTRVTLLTDRSAVSPTQTKSLWDSTKLVYNVNTFGTNPPTVKSATVTAWTTNDWTLGSGLDATSEILYLLIGDAGTNTFPNINRANLYINSTATANSNQKHACTLSTGRHVRAFIGSNPDARFQWSDDGVTWTDYTSGTSDIAGGTNTSIAAYVDSGGTERLVAAWKQSGAGGSRTDQTIYVMAGAFNTGRTTLTWGSAVQISSDTHYNYLDLDVAADSTGGIGLIGASYNTGGGSNGCYAFRVTISSGGVCSLGSQLNVHIINSTTLDVYPSVVLDPSKNAHLAWSACKTGAGFGVRYMKLPYASSDYTLGTQVEVDNTLYIDVQGARWINSRWNSHDSMIVLGGHLLNAAGTHTNLMQYESTNFTSFTPRTLVTNADGSPGGYGGLAIDSSTGDSYYVTGDNTGGCGSVSYYKWTRATTSLSAKSTTDSDTGANVVSPYVYPWFSGSTIRWVYEQGVSSAYGIAYDQISLASAPNAPTLTSPANGAYVDVSGGVTFVPQYNSTDGANQNAYALRAKQAGGSYVYWNATTSLWQATIVWNAITTAPSATWSVTVPASATISNGATLNWSAASQEATANLQGAFATDSTIIMQVAPTLTVTAPTGTVTGSLTPQVQWTTTPAAGAAQTAFRVLVYTPAQYGAGGFSPGVSASYYDSTLTSSPNQYFNIPAGANLQSGLAYRFYVQVTETGGETSSWQYQTATFSVDPPANPTFTVVPGTDGTTGAPRTALAIAGHDNMLTENQASLETDTTGWAAGANTTIARDTAQHVDGVASLKLTATAGGAVSASTPTGTSGVPVLPSTQVTIAATFRANSTGRTTTVQALWWKSDGSASSHPSDTSAGLADASGAWQAGLGANLTVSSPADAAYMSLVVGVAGCGAGEIHWCDNMIVAPGTVTTWTRGGLNGLTSVFVQFSDDNATWYTLRTSGAALAFPAETVTLYDYEAPPGATRYYRVQVQAAVGGSATILSAIVTGSGVGTTPAQWVISDPTDTTSAILFHSNGNPARNLVTKKTMHAPFGRGKQVGVSDGTKGWAGRLPARTTSSTTQKALEALLARNVVLLIQSPEGAGRQWYVQVDSDPTLTQIGSTLGSTVLGGVAGRGTVKMPHTDNVITYAEAECP